MSSYRPLLRLVLAAIALCWGLCQYPAQAQTIVESPQRDATRVKEKMMKKITQAERQAAAERAKAARAAVSTNKTNSLATPAAMEMPGPGETPHYFGPEPNWAFSPPLRKFVDTLPGLNAAGVNNLGQFIPVATPDTITYPGSDYYEISIRQYKEKMHTDLPETTLRGYVQTNNGTDANGQNTIAPSPIHYLGPLIIAQKDKPVRIKFTNELPTGVEGDLFIPVDTTVMGAGMGPMEMPGMPGMPGHMEHYTQNRATLHLHGGRTPWISDGTPHQWITPAGEDTSYPKGVSVHNVPDMPDPGPGAMTFFYTNQQSARLMFYHDHSYGITRLNVYAGEAAGYLITDAMDEFLTNYGVIPADQIPLIIQDKTFVDAATIGATDPTWNWGSMPGMPVTGDLWMPHVYLTAQNPYDISGVNPVGRWHYGPWFWPPTTDVKHGPIPNPYYQPNPSLPNYAPGEPPEIPGVPHPSMGMESFFDTPIVNGTAFPTLEVEPKYYRFRILNAANDRFWNLQLYEADPAVVADDGRTNTEVKMVPASVCVEGLPENWPTDGREGGVPDPATVGPDWIQIGTEGGFLPAPAVVPNQPITWNGDPTTFNFGNVSDHSLLLGPAERADVIVDFSAYAGKTLILYNDAPAAFPALDPRYDYYTGAPDLSETGGHWGPQAGYGPNTRTIMQIKVADTTPAPPFHLDTLKEIWAQGVFALSQDPIIVGQSAYDSAYNTTFPSTWPNWGLSRIQDNSLTFQTLWGSIVTLPMEPKAIQDEMGEAFDRDYGRMSGNLGLEVPNTKAGNQNFSLYAYPTPPVEIVKSTVYGTPIGTLDDGTQIWKITHNGVDTHPIHFHLSDVQLINRVGWDGAIRLPDANELGWKDTIRVSPLEDTIVALRAVVPTVPFQVPNSVRLIDPTMPEGAILYVEDQIFDPVGEPLIHPSGAIDPISGLPVSIINHYINFGYEYVWHCHILSHEEMDMMHAIAVAAPPDTPTNLTANATATVTGLSVGLTWADNSLNETGFTIQRAINDTFTEGLATIPVAENVTVYTDAISDINQTYYYRVFATNTVGDTTAYTGDPEVVGFPHTTVNSGFSNTVVVNQVSPPAPPSNLAATLQAGPRISLTWTDNANNEAGFVVERAVNGGAFIQIATPGPGTGNINFIDTAVTVGNIYAYRVKAVNGGGSSAYTGTVSVSILNTPAAPSNLTATAARANGNNDRVTLRWIDNANNETGFTIQRADNAAFTAGLNTSTTAASGGVGNTVQVQQSGLRRNRTFYFRVQAYNASGASGWSNTFSVLTP